MTDQFPNTVFRASCSLQGQSADQIHHLHVRQADSPAGLGKAVLTAITD